LFAEALLKKLNKLIGNYKCGKAKLAHLCASLSRKSGARVHAGADEQEHLIISLTPNKTGNLKQNNPGRHVNLYFDL